MHFKLNKALIQTKLSYSLLWRPRHLILNHNFICFETKQYTYTAQNNNTTYFRLVFCLAVIIKVEYLSVWRRSRRKSEKKASIYTIFIGCCCAAMEKVLFHCHSLLSRRLFSTVPVLMEKKVHLDLTSHQYRVNIVGLWFSKSIDRSILFHLSGSWHSASHRGVNDQPLQHSQGSHVEGGLKGG